MGSDTEPGIVPRTIQMIFDQIGKMSTSWTYCAAISMFQIYKESVYDLLSTNQHKLDGCNNLTKISIPSENDGLASVARGMKKRLVAPTMGNIASSRSHAIMQIHLNGESRLNDSKRASTVTLVDLAGSESPKSTEDIEETKAINSSLSALNGVFTALKQKSRANFNQSTLTKVLKPNFESKSKTLLITNLATRKANIDATMNSSRFTQIK